jgi:predicted amidohydrolase
MKIAVHQCTSPAGDVAIALSEVRSALAMASAGQADICVLPELLFPGYNQPEAIRELAQVQGGSWEVSVSQMAAHANCGIVFGWAEREGDVIYNAASVFDENGVKIAHYRKRHLFGPQEKEIFEPAHQDCIFTFRDTLCGVLICYDIEFTEPARKLAGQDVRHIFVPTANPDQYADVSDVTIRSRALENAVTVTYANLCGTEGDLTYAGLSVIAGPNGKHLLRCGTTRSFGLIDTGEMS